MAGEVVSDGKSFIHRTLATAVQSGASDVHCKAGEPVMFRINGQLRPLKTPRLTPEHTRKTAYFVTPHLSKSR